MAAPTPVTRLAATGTELVNGKRVSIAIALNPSIDIYEEEVAPPGMDTEDAIDTTTQRNIRWMTYAPGDLIKLTEFDVLCGYTPHSYVSLLAILGIATTLTVRFPNGDKLSFYGYVKTTKPTSMKRREKPKMTITFMPTNLDPVTCEEAAPVFSAGSGTVGCA
jgi:hypothetical protein